MPPPFGGFFMTKTLGGMCMDDFLLLLQAKLDAASLKGIKGNLSQLQKEFEELKLKPVIDQQALSNLSAQINKLFIDNKISVTVDTGQAIKDAQKSAQQIANASKSAADAVTQNEKKKQQAIQETAKAAKQAHAGASLIKSGANVTMFAQTNNAAREASQYFRDLLKDENAVLSVSEKFGKSNGLTSFTVNVKRASGEVESLRYALENVGTKENPFYAFKNAGAELNNANAMKQIKAIENAYASFTQKIEEFKSSNNRKLSGLSGPLGNFETQLSGLKSGKSTIDDVQNSFRLLKAATAEIDAPLKRQLSTFDSYKNAIDKGKESISEYRAELKGLSNAPKDLSQELTKASKLLLQINKTEATEGTTANWSVQAREFVDLLSDIGNKIKVIKKEQANSATTQIFNTKDLDAQGKIYLQKVSNTIAKTKSELESKLRNAGYTDIQVKGVEDANGKIKSLTANVTDATGAFKQLNFERAQLQNKGKAQSGFMQADDVKVIGNISDSIGTVQSNLASLKAKWEEQGILIGEFKNKVEQLESSLASVGNKGELNGLKEQIKGLKDEASTVAKANKIQLSIDTGGYESKVETLIAKTRQWTDEHDNARISTSALKTALDNLGKASSTLSNNDTVANQQALISAEKELDTQIKTITNSVKKMNLEFMKSSAVDDLKQKYQQFYDLNGKSHRQFGSQMKDAMLELSSGAEVSIQRGRELEQQLVQIQNTCRQTGRLGKTFFQTLREGMSSFSYWTSSTFLVMKAFNSIKSGIGTVKALDTALVDLNKTTTMTASELENFYYDSNKVAKQMGVTTEEIINQASAWSRLGYSSEEAASKMAKYSSMFASISPGMDVDTATDGLVSVMKAFDIGNDNPDDVLDGIMSKINIIGNTAATSNAEIVNMLTRSSSAMKEANNTLEETIALETAAVEITRDDASVGTAFKTVAMRIRGYDEETEEFIGNVEELSGEIADLTKTASTPGGISLFTDDAKTEYKSTYQLLKEISEIYNQLSDKNQAGLLEALAGKRQGQIIAATINNFEEAEKALKNMENSAGSAEAEMSVIMDKQNCPYVQKCA